MSTPPTDSSPYRKRSTAFTRIAPWFASTVLHVGLLAIGMIVTWSVVHLDDRPTTHIVADFDAMAYDPIAVLPVPDQVQTEPVIEVSPQITSVDAVIERHLNESMPVSVRGSVKAPQAGQTTVDLAPPVMSSSVRFFGVSETNARDIVYVLDASGSMITGWPDVRQELGRSLRGLSSRQRYAVVVFQDDAIVVPPRDRLRTAGELAWVETMQWLEDPDNVFPSGPTNPIAAFETAMRFEPDIIFLLSQDITGHGRYELDQADLLAQLDRLNPRSPRTGMRATRINTIQFAEPDPLGTMRTIAEQHGGPDGYKFLDRAELGLHRGDGLNLNGGGRH